MLFHGSGDPRAVSNQQLNMAVCAACRLYPPIHTAGTLPLPRAVQHYVVCLAGVQHSLLPQQQQWGPACVAAGTARPGWLGCAHCTAVPVGVRGQAALPGGAGAAAEQS